MDSIPFFPKFVTYSPMLCAVYFFLLSFSKNQYSAWEKTFGEKNAAKFQIALRYVAPPILIVCGAVQLL